MRDDCRCGIWERSEANSRSWDWTGKIADRAVVADSMCGWPNWFSATGPVALRGIRRATDSVSVVRGDGMPGLDAAN